MPMTRTAAALAACATLAALLVACGGDDDGISIVTPGVTSITEATRQTLVTPFPTPKVTGNEIDSSSGKGYTATIPDGWSVKANLIQAADSSADVFFEPLAIGANVQASISITCIVRRAVSEEAHIAFQATTVARIGVNSNVSTSQRDVGGRNATVVSYHFKSQNEANTPELEKSDYLFSAGGCDWKLTTSAPGGRLAEYQDRFNAFLDSFQVTN